MQNLALREIRVDGPYKELYSYAATVRQPEFPVALQVDLRLVRKRRIKKRKKNPKNPPNNTYTCMFILCLKFLLPPSFAFRIGITLKGIALGAFIPVTSGQMVNRHQTRPCNICMNNVLMLTAIHLDSRKS